MSYISCHFTRATIAFQMFGSFELQLVSQLDVTSFLLLAVFYMTGKNSLRSTVRSQSSKGGVGHLSLSLSSL